MKRVVIADDHPIFRAGLRRIVEEDGHEVVAEASDGNSCITSLEITRPDVVVLDLAMPGVDGYQVLEWARDNMPSLIAVIISMHSSRAFATKARELGARAFVAKEDASDEIHNALLTPKGVFYLSASVGGKGLPVPDPTSEARGDGPDVGSLTPAERRVFDLVGQSLTSREIGKRLNLSYRTVQTHRQRINQKLGLAGPNSLVRFALQYRSGETE
ncbi:response regulator transcription factor [Nitratireductor sp. XY-223]|uniref:response regulator transcription factor n=1 Tax=Nitratireductor sp. XY-223 TaxID=2561926 RepID=UPI0010AAD0DB|nr:response regulator transcription factor [Nitratireductor sp. XY-223]